MAEGKLIAGYVLLGVGALLIVVAIVLIIYLLHKRRMRSKEKRPYSPDTFKIVYKVPTDNGSIAKLAPRDMFDNRSIHTLRSEPGYRYVAPSRGRVIPTPVPSVVYNPDPIMAAPSVISSRALPRASSYEHVAVTLPHTGERYIVPAPNGTLPRILIPVNKKKAKQIKKARYARSAYSYGGDTRSVLSVPHYATMQRPIKSVSRDRAYVYGSTPNLTQPVLMYDRQRQRLFSDDTVMGNSHVRNWLTEDPPTSFSGDEADHGRPRSRASSAPTDLDQVNAQILSMRWSPSMRRRLAEMDRVEAEDRRRVNQPIAQSVGESESRGYHTQHQYTETSEEF